MPTIDIPQEVWADRLNEFTAVHDRWLVSLDVVSEDGPHTEIHNLPLLGVSTERADHRRTVVVSVARSASEHLTHMIDSVTRVALQQADDGADTGLEMESADGTRTILRFRASALPETVDGIVPEP